MFLSMHKMYMHTPALGRVKHNENTATYTASLIGKQIPWSSLSSTLLQVATPVETGRRITPWGMETMIIFLTPTRWKYVH